jgi:AraC-like DNA-binding protein
LQRDAAFLELLRRLLDGCRPKALPSPPAAIHRGRQLLDDDPASAVTLADLAQECGLSRFQVLRGFVRATGLTPHAYLMQRRVELARSLIASGAGLADAALAAGFADQSHMTRLFKRTHGYPPGVYLQSRSRR